MTAKEQLLKVIEDADFLLFTQARRYPTQPKPLTQGLAKRQWSSHFFERTAGTWQSEPLLREEPIQQAERESFL